MGNIFNEDFQDFLVELNNANVKYVLVGGYSVIYHGYPRTTGDLDIFVDVTEDNYKNILIAFSRFGLSVFDMTIENFLHNQNINVFSFGRAPVAIEILKEISGLKFTDVYTEAIDTEIDGIKVKIINLIHLKINKNASGRNKDLNDLENLQE